MVLDGRVAMLYMDVVGMYDNYKVSFVKLNLILDTNTHHM
jgi:hypothetical protein